MKQHDDECGAECCDDPFTCTMPCAAGRCASDEVMDRDDWGFWRGFIFSLPFIAIFWLLVIWGYSRI